MVDNNRSLLLHYQEHMFQAFMLCRDGEKKTEGMILGQQEIRLRNG